MTQSSIGSRAALHHHWSTIGAAVADGDPFGCSLASPTKDPGKPAAEIRMQVSEAAIHHSMSSSLLSGVVVVVVVASGVVVISAASLLLSLDILSLLENETPSPSVYQCMVLFSLH
jgi:hypothetical protein